MSSYIFEKIKRIQENRWFDEHNLPELSTPRNTVEQIKMMFEYHRGERNEACFD